MRRKANHRLHQSGTRHAQSPPRDVQEGVGHSVCERQAVQSVNPQAHERHERAYLRAARDCPAPDMARHGHRARTPPASEPSASEPCTSVLPEAAA